MDIIASKHAVEYARNWVVEGNGPLLMEFVTYRYGGHSCAFLSFVRSFYGVAHVTLLIECLTPVLPTARVKKSSGCAAQKILSVDCHNTLRIGVWLRSKSSRCVFHYLNSFSSALTSFRSCHHFETGSNSTRRPRQLSTKLSKRPSNRPNPPPRTSGQISTTRTRNHHSCAVGSGKRCVAFSTYEDLFR